MREKHRKNKFYYDIIKYLKVDKNNGYSLVEIITVLGMLGIMAVIVVPRFFFGDSTSASAEGFNLAKSLVGVTRQRAISQTSAARLRFDPDQSDKFLIEIANTRGCEALTRLSDAVDSGDDEIKVYSSQGFGEGDFLKIGNDNTGNEIIGVLDANTIRLGQPLGSSQSVDSVVELADNWKEDSALNVKRQIGNNKSVYEYLQLPENVTVSANVTGWTLCFNSRGIASIFDNTGASQSELELTFKDASNNQKTLTILRGGAIAPQ